MSDRKRITRTAGEVRFIKDNSGDATSWAFGNNGPSSRGITPDYAFNPRNVKPLMRVLRSTMHSLGHAMSGYSVFAKLKSADISPDGNLGGKGYIMRIADMRRQFMNIVEALSAISDTLYDEVRAPHWAAISRQEDPEEREEIENIVEEIEEIREDPQMWAEEEEAAEDASIKRVASRYLGV